MITFRNTRTGRTVDYPEPPDITKAAAAESERLYKLGTKKAKRDAEIVDERGAKAADTARRTIEQMDTSERWERAAAPEPEPADEGAEEEAPKPKPRSRKPAAE